MKTMLSLPDIRLHVLVALDVLPLCREAALRAGVPANESVLVLRHNRLVGGVPPLELLAELHRAEVEALQHVLHVADAALVVLRDFFVETLLFVLWVFLVDNDGIRGSEVALGLEFRFPHDVNFLLDLPELLSQTRDGRERHGHIAANHLQ